MNSMKEKAFGCTATPTIRLISGSYLDLENPLPEQFALTDIAGALAKICRFGGQCSRFYSVAEHSWHCAMQAQEDGHSDAVIAASLMHDAAEAFVGDIVKPLKNLLPEYEAIESRMEAAIALKFGIDFETTKPLWKEVDRAMLIAERRAMFSADKVVWTGEREVRTLSIEFHQWSPERAEYEFMRVAEWLGLPTK